MRKVNGCFNSLPYASGNYSLPKPPLEVFNSATNYFKDNALPIVGICLSVVGLGVLWMKRSYVVNLGVISFLLAIGSLIGIIFWGQLLEGIYILLVAIYLFLIFQQISMTSVIKWIHQLLGKHTLKSNTLNQS